VRKGAAKHIAVAKRRGKKGRGEKEDHKLQNSANRTKGRGFDSGSSSSMGITVRSEKKTTDGSTQWALSPKNGQQSRAPRQPQKAKFRN